EVQAPTARDVVWFVTTAPQPLTRQDVIARFAEEYHSKVGDLFDMLLYDGALVGVGRDESGSEILYQRPVPPELPPTPGDAPITLEEVAEYVRALPVNSSLWSSSVARVLRTLDRDYYVAPGVKATEDDHRAHRSMAQRPARPWLMRDPQTGFHVPDPNSIYE